jgi:hypothetical protein
MGAAALRRHHEMRAAASQPRAPSPFVPREEHDAAILAAARSGAATFATRIADLEASLASAAEKVASVDAALAERDQRIADLEASLASAPRRR